MTTDVNIVRAILGLIIAIFLVFYLSSKTKIHVFIAMILGSVIAGLLVGLPIEKISTSIKNGFGGTLGSIGIIIGLGVMMGAIFEASGAANRMALTFIKLLGKGKEDIAMAITGFFVSIPVFCDSAMVILSPLAKSLSRKSHKSIVTIGCALAAALLTTHSLVPPTPGPLAVVGYFGLDLGRFILVGLVFSVPIAISGIIYARIVGNKSLFRLPDPADPESKVIDRPYTEEEVRAMDVELSSKNMPGTVISFMPIFLPIVLILINTIMTAVGVKSWIKVLFSLIGDPIVAVMIGVLFAIYGLASTMERKKVIGLLDKSVSEAGVIILVTGAGGALGQVLKDSGAGNVLAQLMISSHIPGVFLPFLMAYLLRFVSGSATVGMLTAGSLTAPVILQMGTVNPYIAGIACCIGSIGLTNVHDSYFWVVNKCIGLTEMKDMFKNWFGCVLTLSTCGFVVLLIASFIFH